MRVDRLVRACTPAPGAWTTFRERRVKLGPVLPTDAEPLAPGAIAASRDTVLVGTGTVPVRLETVQPEGKPPMAAADWARGARLAPGDRFV
jgi:methionyl-tRNA formyltransferase